VKGGHLRLIAAAVLMAAVAVPAVLRSETSVAYRFLFPEPQHHWMEVEASFTELPSAPLELRMSRSSPGRYSIHDFAKNVYDVEAAGSDGRALRVDRPDPHGWTIREHGATVTVRYKVFGDRVDGTYLAVDPTHAHLNMPASVMWARGFDDRPVHLTFVPPAGVQWTVATQLFPTEQPLAFTAPNLQYLMDSPTELGPIAMRRFELDGRVFRFAVHHDGADAELDRFVGDVQKIVAAEREVYGEFPAYEPGAYTFIADYLPYASGDGMEHRNSTIMTSSSAIRSNRSGLLGTVAHEFFHNWNVERIRPRALEPFDLERANMSGELWLAEGFTQYYGPLSMSRAGVADLRQTVDDFNDLITAVILSPGRAVRSLEDMSRMAPFTDGGRTIDRTNWSNSYISYYPFGGAVALALDLTLRERFDGRITLDDFMRAMWRVHGKPAPPRPGYVANPYTIDDAERRLAEVSGDVAFAHEFFARYIHGRDVPDYGTLLVPAGMLLQRQNPGRAWWGDVRLDAHGGLSLLEAPRANTPAYRAGLDVGDELRQIDGTHVATPDDVGAIVRRHKPGDTIAVEYVDRTGVPKTVRVGLEEDPAVAVVPLESTGRALSASQIAFRNAWLGRKG
jgi:predicted metalloprotease with PDZ domain